MAGTALDPGRVLADIDELHRLTGDERGAQRLCWDEGWRRARSWLIARLDRLGLGHETDEAGNLWSRLPGRGAGPPLALGSHLDSVPSGGRLDGVLGVSAALEVLRCWAQGGQTPARDLLLIDFADEEGARFGRSLFGSSALAGTLEAERLAGLRDSTGERIEDVLGANGLHLDRVLEAGPRLGAVGAFLELHIEQGPVLENESLPCAAVAGCAGVEREIWLFGGETAHAGTTPMAVRADAGLAAARAAIAVAEIARRCGGVGTCGSVSLEPGVLTAVPGRARLGVDLRHAEPEPLAALLAEARAAAGAAAGAEGCTFEHEALWRIAPVRFDGDLVAAAAGECAAAGGRAQPLTSGALHDAASLAERVPAAMVFSSSTRGLSHNAAEHTPPEDLRAAIVAFAGLAGRLATGAL